MDETRRLLALLNETFPDVAALPPLEARAAVDARIRPPGNLDDVADAEDHRLEVGGHGLPVRLYRPHPEDAIAGVPTTVYAHGGGFLHGSIEGHDGWCRTWARRTGGPVVSVGYRKAPEHRAPAAWEDMVAAVRWTVQRGHGAHGILVAGDSSGGNLAAGAAVALRGDAAVRVRGQVLLYPLLDPTMSSETYRTRADGYFITAAILAAYWRHYLGADPADRATRDRAAADPRIAPGAADLRGVAPAIVVTAGLDPLHGEGAAYAEQLRGAGGVVLHRHHPDQFHGFLTIPGYGPARAAADMLWADIRSLFAPHRQEHA
ncbi:alpha/beta hydrolase [Microbacterium resistens]|uniref:alpha/beta hydrolase n=1 Tax=Microbacterium resistens TaxID=156977 RepID=UPI0008308C4C|nr:alpha/beta hydrolase [Microbacterium resistens]